MPAKPPGFKWVWLSGGAGFAAGFLGPMMFVPEANQGPLVGILISGPAGLVVGAGLWAICALIKLPANVQWRALYAAMIVGILTTLLCVQPGPALRGYVYDGEIESCASPLHTEAAVIADWNERIARVTWAQPRAGWQADVHRLLRDAPGVVVSMRVLRKNAIRENRKPWNRGSQFASGWTTPSDSIPFYDPEGSCDGYVVGQRLRGYQKYDYDERVEAPKSWPPEALIEVLGASEMAPLPARWANL